MALDSDKFELV